MTENDDENEEAAGFTQNGNVRSHRNRRNKMDTKLLMKISFVTLIIIIFALIAIICVVLFTRHSLSSEIKEADVCYSKECTETAKYLFLNLNPNVDPCEDFYNFSCGGWIKSNPRPEEEEQWSVTEILEKRLKSKLINILEDKNELLNEPFAVRKARQFYIACTHAEFADDDGLEELRAILNKVGGFPLITDNWNPINFNWINAFVYSDVVLNSIHPFFDYSIIRMDDTNSSVIEIESPQYVPIGYALVDEDSTKSEKLNSEIEFREKVKLKVRALRDDIDDIELDKQINEIIAFDTKLANLSMLSDEIVSPEDAEGFTIAEMNKKFTNINWLTIFRDIFKSANIDITENETIIVFNSHYFEKLGDLLKNTPARTLANYISLKIIEDFGSKTIYKFKKIDEESVDATSVNENCYGETEQFFGLALNHLFIEKFFTEKSLNELKGFLKEMKSALTQTLQTNDWMDDDTKLKAQLKLNKMLNYIATPSWIVTNKDLDIFYEDTGFITSENYVNAYKRMSKWKKQMQLKSLRDATNKESFGPSVVNAFYAPIENKIEISTGILQPPNYFPNAPLAVNFGAIGTVIGHEITHGFDEEGSLYDHKGEKKKWWKIETWKLYKQKVNCFEKQYSNYTDPLTGIKINGKRTVGDNIADNGGVHQAFKAYKTYSALTSPEQDLRLPAQMSKFTKDQIFFIAYANTYCANNGEKFTEQILKDDEHSTPDARVMVPLMNSLYFAKAFNCSVNTRMNPINKCVLW